MYGENDKSGEIMLEIITKTKLYKKIVLLCDTTSENGKWTYNGLLRDLGLKLEGKSQNRRLIAGSIMHKNANEMGLLKVLEEIKSEAVKLGLDKGFDNVQNWTLNGLLQSLGVKIERIESMKYAKLKEKTYYDGTPNDWANIIYFKNRINTTMSKTKLLDEFSNCYCCSSCSAWHTLKSDTKGQQHEYYSILF